MFPLDERCNNCDGLKDKLEGPQREASGQGAPEGTQGPRESWWQAPVSAVSTQCFKETNTKRKALPPPDKGLWVHIRESQDSTPRKGQEKETPYM